uniref:Uncharacterized protein n=1 Tax=Myotis myotis TaxID=51298 RepID=A0A7J7TIV6_MYOMY|nr:hypothetical protein mMyoMyo1_009108 [Myotis myotis]
MERNAKIGTERIRDQMAHASQPSYFWAINRKQTSSSKSEEQESWPPPLPRLAVGETERELCLWLQRDGEFHVRYKGRRWPGTQRLCPRQQQCHGAGGRAICFVVLPQGSETLTQILGWNHSFKSRVLSTARISFKATHWEGGRVKRAPAHTSSHQAPWPPPGEKHAFLPRWPVSRTALSWGEPPAPGPRGSPRLRGSRHVRNAAQHPTCPSPALPKCSIPNGIFFVEKNKWINTQMYLHGQKGHPFIHAPALRSRSDVRVNDLLL